MRSLFDEDDREEPKSDADLTLGIGSLLSIFFGVVLICGIFFGFGYSMGRRNARTTVAPTAAVPPQTLAATSPLPENELSGAPLKPAEPDSGAAFPPADTNPATTPTPNTNSDETKAPASAPAPSRAAAKHPAPNAAPPKTPRVVEPATTDTSLNAVPLSHHAPPPAKPHAGVMAPLAQAPGDAPILPGHPIIVQIAAVSRQEDAEVLAGALRKRGFNPSVRPGNGDKFFHVQVGPFTDKSQAETIKQHLLADGYNAIMK
ncbi:MAG: DedD protein [Acidobacteriaceae bacterium]|jgi:cell division septation protein DedD|nr:DedD protein [Acidobacteriaceae bacterium]